MLFASQRPAPKGTQQLYNTQPATKNAATPLLGLLRKKKYKVNGQLVQLTPNTEDQSLQKRKRLPLMESVIRSLPRPAHTSSVHIPEPKLEHRDATAITSTTIKRDHHQQTTEPPPPPMQEGTSTPLALLPSSHSITRLRGYYVEEANRRNSARMTWQNEEEEIEEIRETHPHRKKRHKPEQKKIRGKSVSYRRPHKHQDHHCRHATRHLPTPSASPSLSRKRKRSPRETTVHPPLSPSSSSPSPKVAEPPKRHRGTAAT